jgi:hypothetical protein
LGQKVTTNKKPAEERIERNYKSFGKKAGIFNFSPHFVSFQQKWFEEK